jgi:DNA-binding MarR family transcriptional regulator
MTDLGEASASRPQPTTDHDEFLQQAVERSLILGRVMRLAVQEMRGTLMSPIESNQVACPQPTRRGASGFAEAQYHVLFVLAQVSSRTVGEIADRCHVSVPTISKILNHLEEQGLIERHIDRSNRRVIRVVLTEAGRAAEAQLEQRVKTALEHVFQPLTAAQLADLIVAFGHLEHLVAQAEGPD